MEYHKPRLPLISLLIISCALFFLFKRSEGIFQTKGLEGTEKRLAVNLMKIYEETKDVESIFYENVDRVHNMFEEIKKKDNMNNNDDNNNVKKYKYDEEDIDTEKASPLNPYLAPSFVEMQSKGPVEDETIWRALYDTQLRRSIKRNLFYIVKEKRKMIYIIYNMIKQILNIMKNKIVMTIQMINIILIIYTFMMKKLFKFV